MYEKFVKRVHPKSTHHKNFFLFFLLYHMWLWMVTKPTVAIIRDICKSNHHALNLDSDLCQLFLNKTEQIENKFARNLLTE